MIQERQLHKCYRFNQTISILLEGKHECSAHSQPSCQPQFHQLVVQDIPASYNTSDHIKKFHGRKGKDDKMDAEEAWRGT